MPVDRETIVTDGGTGVLIAVLLVVLLLVIAGGITVFNGGFSFGGHPVTPDVAQVTVTK